MHRHPQAFLGQTKNLGEEGPAETNSIALEVIAKTEITQHLKEGVMTRGVANVFQVIVFAASPHTLLRRAGPGVRPLLETEKGFLKLIHARIGEQQGGVVVRHERARGHPCMALFFKIR